MDTEIKLQKLFADDFGNNLKIQQLTQGYNRLLRVPKRIYRGSRGAYFYVNEKGNRIYLNQRQLALYRLQRLAGLVNQGGEEIVEPEAEEEERGRHQSMFGRHDKRELYIRLYDIERAGLMPPGVEPPRRE